jgi:importin subunit beta-1
MGLIVRVMSVSSALADSLEMISTLSNIVEKGMLKYFPQIKSLFVTAITRVDEYENCAIAISVLGELCRDIGVEILPYCDELIQLLLKALSDPTLNRSVKPPIFHCFGDLAIATGGSFAKYFNHVIPMIQEAERAALFDSDDEDFVDFLNDLREGLLLAYSGIILSSDGQNLQQIGQLGLSFALKCYQKNNKSLAVCFIYLENCKSPFSILGGEEHCCFYWRFRYEDRAAAGPSSR